MDIVEYRGRNVFFGDVDRAHFLTARAMARAFVRAVGAAILTFVIFVAFTFSRKSITFLIALVQHVHWHMDMEGGVFKYFPTLSDKIIQAGTHTDTHLHDNRPGHCMAPLRDSGMV